jgi:hypothetical protein
MEHFFEAAFSSTITQLRGSAPMAQFTIDNGIVDGKTIVQWTEDWWRWILNDPLASAPDNQNPLTDTTGHHAADNNNGPVFFIAGEGLGTTGHVTRSFDVPVGKPLLIPLVNSIDTPPEELPNGKAVSGDDPIIRPIEIYNTVQLDTHVTNLFANIDGQSISLFDLFSKHLVNTPFFSAGVSQPDSIATDFVGATAGTGLDPAMSGGYWLMISGLSPGVHTLNFGGAHSAYNVSFGAGTAPAGTQDVTDIINVVQHST